MTRKDFSGLVEILACPNCYGDLLSDGINDGDEVVSGRLRCAGCTASYPISESVIYLIVPDASWRCVLQEAVSWKSYELEQKFLKRTGRVSEGQSMAEEYHLECEKDRQLKFQAEHKYLFEKLLPYAIVFGVEKVWAKQFIDLNLNQPNWYKGTPGQSFNSVLLANNLSRSLNTINRTASPPSTTRSSSGFSSGFSSGSSGGGGGGGGGSW